LLSADRGPRQLRALRPLEVDDAVLDLFVGDGYRVVVADV
jgi:hypothetical protein